MLNARHKFKDSDTKLYVRCALFQNRCLLRRVSWPSGKTAYDDAYRDKWQEEGRCERKGSRMREGWGRKGEKGWKDCRSRPAVVWEDAQIASLSFRRTRRERRSVCTHVNSAIGPDVRGDVRARWRGLSRGGPAAFENGIARRGCSRIARTLRKDGRTYACAR